MPESLSDTLNATYHLLRFGLAHFVFCALLCIPLAMLFPVAAQPRFRKGMGMDTAYWVLDALYQRPLVLFFSFLAASFIPVPGALHRMAEPTLAYLRSLPLILQFIILALSLDFMQYWVHRALHHDRLWKFHSIHHSSQQVDWLSATRLHPVNTILYSALPFVVVMLAGFQKEAFMIYGFTMAIISPLNHSNVNWTYGPFRYVIGSPVYHRWHHTEADGTKNLAFLFPFIDLVFGTFYMPPGRLPEATGTAEPVPEGFLSQMMYPFRGNMPT